MTTDSGLPTQVDACGRVRRLTARRACILCPRVPAVMMAVFPLLVPASCDTLRDPNVPDPIRLMMEPETGGEYEYYRPSSYDRAKAWPLVIVCHGTGMDGTANAELRKWTSLSESQGFFVAAPKLVKPKSRWKTQPGDREDALRTNERLILGTVRHLQGGHHISVDRIFLVGRSTGAAPALFTGLSHPDLFRAVAVVQPKFDLADLGPLQGRVDVNQPVLLRHLPSDPLTGKDARSARDWLLQHHGDIVDDRGGYRNGAVDRVVDFFEYVVASRPWAHVKAYAPDAGKPLEIRFELKASFAPTSFEWDFGDGSTSLLSSPTHVYAEAGTYRVQVTLGHPSGKAVVRALTVSVGDGS